MKHDDDYSCIVFFPEARPKKWAYVHKLRGFIAFLNEKHKKWKYVNVYDRRTTNHLRRIYPGDLVPDFLTALLIVNLSLISHYSHPLNSTFDGPPLTFNNGFNNTATISTPSIRKGGAYEPS